MGALEGRVAIVTGAGRGLGRAHALQLAAEGAKVVVNDPGWGVDGTDATEGSGAAEEVAEEICRRGGEAVACAEDVTCFEAGERLVETALQCFGSLDVLVNSAGILRDRSVTTMSEDDWDSVVAVHLKGHFVPVRFAAAYWRAEAKAGRLVEAAIVNTTSTSGLMGNPGQSNYGAAKAGVAAFTLICAQELAPYGVRVNAISPVARTRMTETLPSLAQLFAPPEDPAAFDVWDPANVSPLVAYLASASCSLTGRVFFIQGGRVQLFEPWRLGEAIEKSGRWTIAELAEALPRLVGDSGSDR
jgi:NAD(P)-dependent dehydrogenase (short-subunit alcohol dehydrogenase family)